VSKREQSSKHNYGEFNSDEAPNSTIGSLRGAKPLFLKKFSPFPLLRGRGIKGDRVI